MSRKAQMTAAGLITAARPNVAQSANDSRRLNNGRKA